MRKYLSVFKISFEQEFVYRLNFVMWRVRNILQIFILFFLWDSVFSTPGRVVFGYDRAKILTYVFGLLLIRPIVTATRLMDVAGEISDGKLTNYLLKPVNYFGYWFVRDVSSKALNLCFAVVEFGALYLLLRPPFFFQTNPIYLLGFFAALALAVILFFLLLFIFDTLVMWYPDQGWGIIFLLLIFVDFLGGGVFPLDVLPKAIQNWLYVTPFPYLLFMPLQIYLGKLPLMEIVRAIAIAAIWAGALWLVLQKVWRRGLRVYESQGR